MDSARTVTPFSIAKTSSRDVFSSSRFSNPNTASLAAHPTHVRPSGSKCEAWAIPLRSLRQSRKTSASPPPSAAPMMTHVERTSCGSTLATGSRRPPLETLSTNSPIPVFTASPAVSECIANPRAPELPRAPSPPRNSFTLSQAFATRRVTLSAISGDSVEVSKSRASITAKDASRSSSSTRSASSHGYLPAEAAAIREAAAFGIPESKFCSLLLQRTASTSAATRRATTRISDRSSSRAITNKRSAVSWIDSSPVTHGFCSSTSASASSSAADLVFPAFATNPSVPRRADQRDAYPEVEACSAIAAASSASLELTQALTDAATLSRPIAPPRAAPCARRFVNGAEACRRELIF